MIAVMQIEKKLGRPKEFELYTLLQQKNIRGACNERLSS